MANLLKIKGGVAGSLPVLNDREPGWTTDTFKLYVGQGGVSKLVGEADFLKLTGGTLTGALTLNADPSSALHSATKQYVDSVATGLDIKASCRVATAAALPACTAAGSKVGKTLTMDAVGVLTVDGVATALNNRILVKDQAIGANNGIYRVTTEGTASVAAILTRATDADQDAEVTAGMFTFIEEGTENADNGLALITNDPITVDTTALVFSQFTGTGAIVAGAGLTKTGNTLDVVGTADRITANADSIDIASTYAGQTSITTLGTIATGTWSATAIGATKGGTGQTVYAVGDVLQADATTTLAKLAAVATGNALISGGAGVVSSWGKIGLTTHVSGILPTANGGTGIAFFTAAGPTVARVYTFPDVAGTVDLLGEIQTFSGAKTFSDAKLIMAGATSGTTTLKATAAAGTTIATFPASTGNVLLDNSTIDGGAW